MKSKCCDAEVIEGDLCSNCGSFCEVDPFVTIKIKPMSVNKAWQGRRFKSKAYVKWGNDIHSLLPDVDKPFEGDLSLQMEFGFSTTISDIDNPIKTLMDSLQFKYQFDDRQIIEISAKKKIVKKGFEYIRFHLKEL